MEQEENKNVVRNNPEVTKASSVLRKKLLRSGVILLAAALLVAVLAAVLLLGKVQTYPIPTPDIMAQFQVMNKISRQFLSAMQQTGGTHQIPSAITITFNSREVNTLLTIGESFARKKDDPVQWHCNFDSSAGLLEIFFSRPLAGSIGLNGCLKVIPSYKNDVLDIKVVSCTLGRVPVSPRLIQGRLDEELFRLEGRKEYAIIRNFLESLTVKYGTVITVLKTENLKSIPRF